MRCRLLLIVMSLPMLAAAVWPEPALSAESRSGRSVDANPPAVDRDPLRGMHADPADLAARQRESSRPRGVSFQPAATCCQPPASTVVRNDRPLVRWVLAESDLGDVATTDATPDATPAAPAADASTPRAEATVQPAAADKEVARALERWSAASRTLEPFCPARSRRLTRAHQAERRGHEIALLGWFQGPVDADALTRRYDWSLVSPTGRPAVLAGAPRDATERLFVERFEMTLDDTGLPAAIRFFERSGAPRGDAVALTERRFQCETIAMATAVAAGSNRPRRQTAARPAIVQTAELPGETGDRGDDRVRQIGATTDEADVERALADWSRALSEDRPRPMWFSASTRDRLGGVVRKQYHRAAWEPNGAATIQTAYSSFARMPVRRESPSGTDVGRADPRAATPVADDAPGPVAGELLFAVLGARRPEKLAARFRIEAEPDGETERRLWLRPRTAADRFGQIELMLSTDTGRPISARAVDRSGRYETVWTVMPSEPLDAPN